MTEPRDDSFDRLLRQTLRQPSEAGATPLCLDAETMAAWLDGGLSGPALAAAEAHASTCPRCRALVAVMARSETAAERPLEVVEASAFEPEGEPASHWWPWLVPLTAAALIALAIWIPRRAQQPAQESTIASAPRVETAPQVVPPGSIDERQQTPPPEQNAQAAAAKDAPSARPEIAKSDQAELRRESASAAPPRTPSALPASPPSPAAQSAPVEVPVSPPSAPATAVAGAEPVVAPSPAPAAPRAFLQAAQETVIAEFQSTAPSASSPPVGAAAARGGTGAGRGAGAAAAGGGGGGGRGGRAEPTFRTGIAPPADGIAPPNASLPTRWRVLASGIVERSTPPGAPWELVPIGPPGTRVTNGGAPSPLVCWLVGRSGVVFLTIDGRSFARIPFPETVDLASVRATSAREATITTTDGRTFVTTDGGQTWSPR